MTDNLFLEVNFDGVEEPKLFALDEEVNLTITRAEMHQSKNGDSTSLHCVFKSTDRTGYAPIDCYFPNPEPNPSGAVDIADKNNAKMLKRKRFFEAFNIDTSARRLDLTDPLNNDLTGHSGWCVVGIEVDNNGQFPDKNFIKRFSKR